MYSTIIKEEKEYFNSVLEKLKEGHKQIVADKQEIDMQLNAGIRTGRRKEDFERKKNRQKNKIISRYPVWLAESAVKQYQTRIEHSRPEERAVTILLLHIFSKTDRYLRSLSVPAP